MAVKSIESRMRDNVYHEPNSGYWLWGGTTINSGYGMINRDGKKWLAHRVAYELEKGPIPSGLVIDHLCRVRLCVNPAHLEAVPQSVNVRRGMQGGSTRVDGLFICRNCGGTEFYRISDSSCVDGFARDCRSCSAARNAAYHRENKHKISARKRAAWAAKKAAK